MNNSKLIAAKRIAVAVAAVCATMSAPAFAADDVKNLLDLMLKKGVITQAEYDDYMKSDAYENSQFKEKRTDSDVSKSIKFIQKREKDGAVKGSGLGLVSEDGKNEINLTGRMHFDSRFFNSEFEPSSAANQYKSSGQKNSDQFDIRRARIGFNGKILNDFSYEMVWNAVSSDSSNIDTGWINYGAVKEAQIRIGRFKQPFNLEEQTSSNNIDFIERSYVNQVTPGKKVGIMLHGVPMDGVAYGVSTFQETNSTITASGNKQYAARVTANIAKLASIKDSVLHFGLGATDGSYDSAIATSSSNKFAGLSLRNEPRGVDAYKVENTGTTDFATKITKSLIGVEGAYSINAFKIQSEYVEAKFKQYDQGVAGADADLKAKIYYVAAVYNITGESWADAYRDGTWSSVRPKSNFTANGGTGALQVGLRYSAYDAERVSGTATGSPKGNTTTLGLTWFINPNARVLLNHSVTKFGTAFTPSSMTGGDSERVTTLRMQYNF
jgi:phosphate-selective porin OprO/OprP